MIVHQKHNQTDMSSLVGGTWDLLNRIHCVCVMCVCVCVTNLCKWKPYAILLMYVYRHVCTFVCTHYMMCLNYCNSFQCKDEYTN